ncbi:MAG: pyridoxal-phosphate dependent enzyme [Promethearchaeota archaeon]
MDFRVVCRRCQSELSTSQRSMFCPQCSSVGVQLYYDAQVNQGAGFRLCPDETGMWKYRNLLPDFEERISLGEGDTPLWNARHTFRDEMDLAFKIEGENPTGSYFDRASSLMVSDALVRGAETLVCASDGNLGASLSAYCAAAQISCVCVVPRSTPPVKVAQMEAHGAEVLRRGGTIDESLRVARKLLEPGWYQATPQLNVLTIEGTKTIALEIVEHYASAGRFPDSVIVPVGSGTLLYALWTGFQQAAQFGMLPEGDLPRLVGVQVEGYDPITKALRGVEGSAGREGKERKKRGKSQFLADAIVVDKPLLGELAIETIRSSGGTAVSVSERALEEAHRKLGTREGIFAETSSATVVAALEDLSSAGYFHEGEVVVAVITASGFKTSTSIQSTAGSVPRSREVIRLLGTKLEILELICAGEFTFGYSIWEALDKKITLQAVYQHLKELKVKGHIEETGSSTRQKKYRITERGALVLSKMKELEALL